MFKVFLFMHCSKISIHHFGLVNIKIKTNGVHIIPLEGTCAYTDGAHKRQGNEGRIIALFVFDAAQRGKKCDATEQWYSKYGPSAAGGPTDLFLRPADLPESCSSESCSSSVFLANYVSQSTSF